MERLTVKRLCEIMMDNNYILLRNHGGDLIGHNCKIVNFKMFNDVRNADTKTIYTSFRPCSFNEYISHKTAFM